MSKPIQPPHSSEAEQAVLGAILLSQKALDTAVEKLFASDFYAEKHRLIFRAACELNQKSEAVDAVSVAEWFSRNNLLDSVDGGAYVTMLANETPGTANAIGYINIIRRKAMAREMIEQAMDAADDLYGGADPQRPGRQDRREVQRRA
ncbi:MAG TPA: DnaB-like helicase N-terminal domain-containing protein, partial [Tichowtungia sp.]|nr:DnaB-like helicase N-terminal domain-containing protein [Tichowtungia sp.]